MTKSPGAYRERLVVLLIIFAAVFVAYIPALGAGYIWDDNHHVYANPHLFEPGGLFRIWFTKESQQYYPLVYTSFWLEWRLWGGSPAGYHAVNVALHAANAFLLYLILSRLGFKKWAAVAALIFAVHPVHVESVAWVSERKNVLSGFFYLLSALAYISHDDRGGGKLYGLALSLFILALLSKTVTSTLPAVLVVIAWLQGKRINAGYIIKLLPFFVIGVAMGLLTAWWEVAQVGAEGAEWKLGIAERLLIPGRAALFYVSKIFVPLNLVFIYPRWELNPGDLKQWLYPAAVIVACVAFLALKGRTGKGPAAALAFFLITLFPALGFFNVYPFRYSFVADHFQYLASIGVIVLVVGAVAAMLKGQRAIKTALAIIVTLALLFLTFNQGKIYKNEETLWKYVLEKNPSAWMAHNNLGGLYAERGAAMEAIEHFKEALRLKPDDVEARLNLAATMFSVGRAEAARRIYLDALRLKPGLPKALVGLSLAAMTLGNTSEAYDASSAAVAASPGNAEAHNSLGMALERMGGFDEAINHYRLAIESSPRFIQAYNNLGVALARLGRYDDAVGAFDKAIEIKPSYVEARLNAATILTGLGRLVEAERHLEEALRVNAGNARAWSLMGDLHLAAGRRDAGVESYSKALELNAELESARLGLERARSE